MNKQYDSEFSIPTQTQIHVWHYPMSKRNFQRFCAISETSATQTGIQTKSADRFCNDMISEKQRIKKF